MADYRGRMKRVTSVLLILGLLTASLEGAADKVTLSNLDGGSGPHELHQQHHWDGPANLGDDHARGRDHGGGHDHDRGHDQGGDAADHDGGDPSHTHVCHCGLHAPPFASHSIAVGSTGQYLEPLFDQARYASLSSAPLLRPPIA